MTSAGFEPMPISSETNQTLKSPQTSTKTDTIKTSEVIVGAEKAASMVMYATVFQALFNRVETLEMYLDNAIFQFGNPGIENLQMKSNMTRNVQRVTNYQYILDNLANKTQTMQDKVVELGWIFQKTRWRFNSSLLKWLKVN